MIESEMDAEPLAGVALWAIVGVDGDFVWFAKSLGIDGWGSQRHEVGFVGPSVEQAEQFYWRFIWSK